MKKLKPLERDYLEKLKDRDRHEKKEHQATYEDFQKYSEEIKALKTKNNELRDFFQIIFAGQGSELK